MTENYANELRERGWAHVDFGISERERAGYAELANKVITIATEEEKVADALALDLMSGAESGPVRTGSLGISRSRNSADDKIYLHTGLQSRQYADSVLPERHQPMVMRSFWEANDEMLSEVEKSMKLALKGLGATALEQAIFPAIVPQRNLTLRTVRYNKALEGEVGKEVVSGHADLGAITEHLYETHGGWFRGVAYPPELISDDNSTERQVAITEMRRGLRPIDNKPGKAIFFLGAAWHNLPDELLPAELRDLPACYHAGFRPDEANEEVSPYAGAVTDGSPDRVSVVVFAHPSVELQKAGIYQPASVPQCRPDYVT